MFGLNCALKIFQRVLRTVLQNYSGAENFLDDIIVYRNNKVEHDFHLMKVCNNVLRENGLTLDLKKCKITK